MTNYRIRVQAQVINEEGEVLYEYSHILEDGDLYLRFGDSVVAREKMHSVIETIRRSEEKPQEQDTAPPSVAERYREIYNEFFYMTGTSYEAAAILTAAAIQADKQED